MENVEGKLSSSPSCKNYYEILPGMTTLQTDKSRETLSGIMDFEAKNLDDCHTKCLQSGHCSAHQVEVLENGEFRCRAWFDNMKSNDKEKNILPDPNAMQVDASEFSTVRPMLASASGPLAILFRNDSGPTQVRPLSCRSPLNNSFLYDEKASRQECEYTCKTNDNCASYTYSTDKKGMCEFFDSKCNVLRGDLPPKSLGPNEPQNRLQTLQVRNIFVSKPNNNSLSCRNQIKDFSVLEKTDGNYWGTPMGTCHEYTNCRV